MCEKTYAWNPAYVLSHTKKQNFQTIPTNFHETKTNRKTQNLYILLAFLLNTLALLIDVSIYGYLIKH